MMPDLFHLQANGLRPQLLLGSRLTASALGAIGLGGRRAVGAGGAAAARKRWG